MSLEGNVQKEVHTLSQRLCLRVTAENEPSALIRVLQCFQQLNLLPQRVSAESATTNLLHIEVHLTGISPGRLSLITAKIAQFPPILNAHWYYC
jgi:hypothetical protein